MRIGRRTRTQTIFSVSIALLVCIRVTKSNANDYDIIGESVSVGVSRNRNQVREVEYKTNQNTALFELSVNGCEWNVRLRNSADDYKSVTEIYCDGTNIFSLSRNSSGQILAGPEKGAFSSIGTVYSNTVPMGSGHLQGIWLAFCSACGRQSWPSNFPDLYAARRHQRDIAQAEFSFDTSGLIQTARITPRNPGAEYSYDTFQSLATTNLAGVPLVTSFKRTIYAKASPVRPSEQGNDVLLNYLCSLHEIKVNTSDQIQPLQIQREALLRDTRILGETRPVPYRSSNWLSVDEIISNPVTRATIQRLIQKPQVKGTEPKALSAPTIRVTRYIIVGIICCPLAFLIFWRIWNAQKSRRE